MGSGSRVSTRPRDLLIITADHGCDPTTPGTDHTREHVPLLARFEGHDGRRHDGPFADVGASVLHWLTGGETHASWNARSSKPPNSRPSAV